MSNVGNLKSLLNKTKDYIISTIFPVFLTNNTYDDANIYELSLLIKYLLIMAPDQIFPYIKSIYVPSLSPLLIQIRSMLSMVAHNRAIYDILVLLLSYPEKRASLLDNVIHMNVDEDSSSATTSDSEFKESYNVGYGSKC